MRIEHALEIEAPPDRVWGLTLDVEAWPRITPTMTSVERLDAGPLAVGSRVLIKQPGQRKKVWTVTHLDPVRTFAWSARAFGTTMTAFHHLKAAGAGTRNTLVVEIDGGPAPLVGRLLRRPILSAITRENEGFKEAAEASG